MKLVVILFLIKLYAQKNIFNIYILYKNIQENSQVLKHTIESGHQNVSLKDAKINKN